MEVGDTTHHRRQVDHVRAPLRRGERLREQTQISSVHLAAFPHPVRRGALIGDAHLEVRVGEEPSDHCRADRADAAGDEHAAHLLASSEAISEL